MDTAEAISASGQITIDPTYEAVVNELIKTLRDFFSSSDYAEEPKGWTAPQRVVWRSSGLSEERRMDIINDRTVDSANPVCAIVNSGRWIVKCSDRRCGGAQYASFADRRYWCLACGNKQVGGQWRQVIWPQEVDAIEQSILSQPIDERHWSPEETTD